MTKKGASFKVSSILMATSTEADKQPYKYGNKELDSYNGLNWYDFEARYLDSGVPSFTTPDPHAEKYFSWSPYAYVGNNPIIRTDPTGMDWYQDSDGTYQYNKNLTENTKDLFIAVFGFFGKEISYIGETYQATDGNGNVTANYRQDGSIMYANDTDGYNRIVSNTIKTGREEKGAILEKGVLVLPNYKNEKTEAYYKEYGYDFKNGTMFDPVTKKAMKIEGTLHTHPNSEDMTGDVSFSGKKTPLKPMYALSTGGERSGNVDFLLHSGQSGSYVFGRGSRDYNLTVSNITSGSVNLRSFSRSIVRKHTRTGKFVIWP